MNENILKIVEAKGYCDALLNVITFLVKNPKITLSQISTEIVRLIKEKNEETKKSITIK